MNREIYTYSRDVTKEIEITNEELEEAVKNFK